MADDFDPIADDDPETEADAAQTGAKAEAPKTEPEEPSEDEA